MGEEKAKPAGVWPTVKPFVNGGASGMLATCVMQPIDMIKNKGNGAHEVGDQEDREQGKMTDDLQETTVGPEQEGRRAGHQVRHPGGTDCLLQCLMNTVLGRYKAATGDGGGKRSRESTGSRWRSWRQRGTWRRYWNFKKDGVHLLFCRFFSSIEENLSSEIKLTTERGGGARAKSDDRSCIHWQHRRWAWPVQQRCQGASR
ncbi:hypothetical protein RJ639_002164 [Escallonia herrerae]|uniref:Uncharacterized protein n=1 Tax=Escallonia herrerae TaxID=1293975 RepID=A0AA88XJH0_9ASTE|nr:hypothetical protein RJ639_002164 [Escallonia herrerae]